LSRKSQETVTWLITLKHGDLMDQYQQETPDQPPRPPKEDPLSKELQQRLVYLEQRVERQQETIDRLKKQLMQLEASHRITQHRVFR